MQTLPLTRDLVLIGGGHAHALVLRAWGMDPLPGARVTLINPGPTAPYTGMLPGFVAGHYSRAELEIDLVRLCRFAGARLVLGMATGLARAAGLVEVEGRAPIGYDVASVDIGIHSGMPDLPGFAAHGVAAKPLELFAAAWTTELERLRADPSLAQDGAAVIGGGVGGVELAMAMAHGAERAGARLPVTVIEEETALHDLGRRAREALLRRIRRSGVTLIEGTAVAEVTAAEVVLRDGRRVASRFTAGAAGARPHRWPAATGLTLQDGFISVDGHLQSSDPAIFAAGDCAHLSHAPRPKAGVFAVRAAPVLTRNLRAALGDGGMRRFRPQRSYLKLISTGGRSAVAEKAGLAAEGDWVWRWKDRIDRRFMARLDDLPAMPARALPKHRAAGLAEEVADGKPMCGGCGAKVGRGALARALSHLAPIAREDIEMPPADDAALLTVGNARLALTTDQLRGFTEDHGVMARIAAVHAMGDVWAMGGAPQAALATLTLPRQSPRLQERVLAEITLEAGEVFAAAGAAIVGGHTALGSELSVGFSVTGLAPDRPITLAGAQPGDALVLTKPLGSGTILAAEMALAARGGWVAGALEAMQLAQGGAAVVLGGAHAMTDVTGFGLAGHLMGMLDASRVSARLDLAAVPLMEGALELARAGHRSTLFPSNREVAQAMILPEADAAALLFDPQTAGGLLAAVAEDEADALVAALCRQGHRAARIGEVLSGPPLIEVR